MAGWQQSQAQPETTPQQSDADSVLSKEEKLLIDMDRDAIITILVEEIAMGALMYFGLRP